MDFLGNDWYSLGVVPIMINNLAVYGYDVIRPMVAAATFASAGVALGVFLRSKDKNVKVLSLSAIVPALLGGITEPIVYGLSVKYKKPLIAQTIAGGIAGAFMGAMQTKAIVYVFPALTTLPAFLGDTFVYYLIGIALAFFLSAILTFAFGLGEESSSSNEEIEEQVNEISVPLNGEVIALEKVNDPVFSEKTMGDGFAVIPTDGVIKAPFSGKVEAVFPTKHAIGLKSKSGVEVLIHIGINTVELNGKYFDIVIEAGDDIQKGQKIGSFDIEGIQSEGYDPTTVIVLTNLNDLNEVDMFDSNGKIIQTFTGKKTGQAEILA
ncbi:glucose PTS transporter subunit IIA [Enterococcus faecium]|jgi:PTS system beta-glucosides-specific IIC component|uniref:glucose PTS transporter subunit IIA n=1 Tax=Enterococcus faecium TaxID=1352 RepID=UPI001E41C180|nr:glucose PTS transporter subunit IIA [Enterococcus faecium]WCG53241.1 glucose PTS transporter subunit IIA [Enterococcus faecium]